MELGSTTALLSSGALLMLTGILLRRQSARYDLRGMLTDSIGQLLQGKRRAGRVTDIEQKFRDIVSAQTSLGKARRATGSILGHFLAQITSLVSLALILSGGVLILLGGFVGV